MMDLKISAVKRIMDSAENTAVSQQEEEEIPESFTYFNAKNLIPAVENATTNDGYPVMKLTPNEHFYNMPVNVTHSAVHVPTNVYDRCK